MGKILDYANDKEKLDKTIADEVRKLYLDGLDYQVALGKAKEIFLNKKATKDTDQDSPR